MAPRRPRTRAILESHFSAMETWHAAHDPILAPLWSEWAAKRNQPNKDEAENAAGKKR